MCDRFTDRSIKAMQLAHHEARRLNHEYVGTEHILLGLLNEGGGLGATCLLNLGVSFASLREEIYKLVQRGYDFVTTGNLPQTPRARNVIDYSTEEARTMGHELVGTEHILFGLLREQEGVASIAIINLGITLEKARQEVARMLRTGAHDDKLSDRPDIDELNRLRNENEAMRAALKTVHDAVNSVIAGALAHGSIDREKR